MKPLRIVPAPNPNGSLTTSMGTRVFAGDVEIHVYRVELVFETDCIVEAKITVPAYLDGEVTALLAAATPPPASDNEVFDAWAGADPALTSDEAFAAGVRWAEARKS